MIHLRAHSVADSRDSEIQIKEFVNYIIDVWVLLVLKYYWGFFISQWIYC